MSDRLLRTLRVRNEHRPGVLGRLATAIGSAGANLGDIRTVWVGPDHIERDLDVLVEDARGAREDVLAAVRDTTDVELLDVIDDVHELHIDGKLEVRATHPVQSIHDLRRVYTPGVAEVVRTIAANPDDSYIYTIRGKTVAIVTNGTRVLGLGNVGPVASLPVMEGKAALLHQFVGISAWPIVLDDARRRRDRRDGAAHRARASARSSSRTSSRRSASRSSERLVDALEMPVLHDDQHGTAVAALAAVDERDGARGARPRAGARRRARPRRRRHRDRAHAPGRDATRPVLGFDPAPDARERLRAARRRAGREPGRADARAPTCVSRRTGRAGLIRREPGAQRPGHPRAHEPATRRSRRRTALAAGAAFAADGRSVNNLLGFPGILRAAIDARARRITREMYVAAARAIAELAGANELVPNPLRRDVHRAVARAVARGRVRRPASRAQRSPHRLHARGASLRARGRARAELRSRQPPLS